MKNAGHELLHYWGSLAVVSFHTQAISMGITKAEAATLVNAASKLKGILSGKRNGGPAAHS